MGAFLLYNKTANILSEQASEVFERKGFDAPNEFSLGSWCLRLYKKIMPAPQNYVADKSEYAVFCTGTFAYRSLGYRESLVRALKDWKEGRLDQFEMIGSYCLIFWDGEYISVLLDRAQTYHVFCNDEYTLFSSSFLAALEAAPRPLPINRLALCEKLSTGYIVAPDTLVSGINHVNGEVARAIDSVEQGLVFLPVEGRPSYTWHREGFENSVIRQIEQINSHFGSMNAIHCEYGGELGLSGGYDSRLVLAGAKYLSKPMGIHTHATRGVHDSEARIARDIAGFFGLKLTIEKTMSNDDLSSEELDIMLEDNLYFYDGRCSHNMGAFSQVYTREYKIRSLGHSGLSWNGLGGEVFRNYYCTPNRSMDCKSWMDRHVYYPFAEEAWGKTEQYQAMHDSKVRKISQRLAIEEPNNEVDFLWTRRYYGEVRMPDCDAVNIQATNQLKFSHAPFLEPKIVEEAICASDYIGSDGAYQAFLIRTLSSELAGFKSHYGHDFEGIPLRKIARSYLKGITPLKLQRARIRGILERSATQTQNHYFNLLRSSGYGAEILSVLENDVFEGDWKLSLVHYAQRPTTISVANFLRAFRHKIAIG